MKKYYVIGILSFCVLAFGAEFSTEVVGQIGKEIVTSRKISADILIDTFLKDKKNIHYEHMKVQSEGYQAELDRFLIERVVYLESKTLSLVQEDDAEVRLVKKNVLARIKKSPAALNDWDKLALSEDEQFDLIKQKLVAQKFEEFKSKSSLVPVTEAEAFNSYQNNKKLYGDKDYKLIKDDIKKSLAADQAQQRLADWYDILRKKYDVTKVVAIN